MCLSRKPVFLSPQSIASWLNDIRQDKTRKPLTFAKIELCSGWEARYEAKVDKVLTKNHTIYKSIDYAKS